MSDPVTDEIAICDCGESLVSSRAARQLPEFVYDRLSTPDSCRIFMLAPGAGDEQIAGRLEEVSLPQEIVRHSKKAGSNVERNSGYNALSYTWTSDESTKPSENKDPATASFGWKGQLKPHAVVVDEHWFLPATCNLFSALLRLRDTKNEHKLFVDAISIDQGTDADALAERGNMVKRMGHVFSHADLVYADLGNFDDGAARAVPIIQLAASIDREHFASIMNTPNHLRSELCPYEIQRALSDREYYLNFATLCRRKYWRRIWCVQEVLLSRRAYCLLNQQSIQQRELQLGVYRLLYLLGHYRDEQPAEVGELLSQSARRILTFIEFVSFYRNSLADSHSPTFGGGLIGLWDGGLMPLEAEVPHDQIYALLSLTTTQQRATTAVDYSIPYDQLLVSVAAYAVNQGYLGVVLHQAARRQTRPGLPSWCTDPLFNKRLNAIDNESVKSWRKRYVGYHAAKGASLPARHTVLGSHLSVDGLECCTIAATAKLWGKTELDKNWRDRNTAPLWDCYRIFEGFTNGEKHIDRSIATEILWKTFSAEDKCYQDAKKEFGHMRGSTWYREALSILEKWLDQYGPGFTPRMMDDYDETVPARRLLDSVLDAAFRRQFAMTSDGRPGLVPQAAQVGDKIVVLCGCPTCYVIRPTGRGTFTYIGSAYIYGLMDGEAMEPGRHQRELFVLE